MLSNSKSVFHKAPIVLGLGAAVLWAGAAWAGADDGGNKAFFANPGPGAAFSQVPSDTGTVSAAPRARAVSARPAFPTYGASATVSQGTYESYRTTMKHRDRYRIPRQAD